jgi:hypothetical protein
LAGSRTGVDGGVAVAGGDAAEESFQFVTFARDGPDDDRAGLKAEFDFRTFGQIGLRGVGAGDAEGETVAPLLDGGGHESTMYLRGKDVKVDRNVPIAI